MELQELLEQYGVRIIERINPYDLVSIGEFSSLKAASEFLLEALKLQRVHIPLYCRIIWTAAEDQVRVDIGIGEDNPLLVGFPPVS